MLGAILLIEHIGVEMPADSPGLHLSNAGDRHGGQRSRRSLAQDYHNYPRPLACTRHFGPPNFSTTDHALWCCNPALALLWIPDRRFPSCPRAYFVPFMVSLTSNSHYLSPAPYQL